MSQDAQSRNSLLRTQAVSFCNAFLSQTPPNRILDDFFTRNDPQITEHGPEWARSRLPFLSRTFVGRRKPTSTSPSTSTTTNTENDKTHTCDDYFRLLGETLAFEVDRSSFPPSEGFVVDPDARTEDGRGGGGIVMVVARGVFRSVKTGREWSETFVHRLSGFDDQGRIGCWDIWADPLSAWTAVGGEEFAR